MKVVLCLCLCLSVVLAKPQGSSYQTHDAIKQAQNSNLIPRDAQIHKVSEIETEKRKKLFFIQLIQFVQVDQGIEVAAYEGIPGNQQVDLKQILGNDFPAQVISNLQVQIDSIGRHWI